MSLQSLDVIIGGAFTRGLFYGGATADLLSGGGAWLEGLGIQARGLQSSVSLLAPPFTVCFLAIMM